MASAISDMSAVCHKESLCLVNAMHITASVKIIDDERGILSDYEKWLEELTPHATAAQYLHNRTGQDNADVHLKRQIMGREAWLLSPKAVGLRSMGAGLLRGV